MSQELFWTLLAGGLGLLVGSFLNVVIVRLPRDQSIVRPRSRCPSCDHLIAWYDNIPVVSFLVLRGRCRHCSTKISIRYPVIELLTAILFLACLRRFGVSWALFFRDWPLMAALVAVTFIDLEHRIIPDEISYGGIVWGLLTSWLTPEPGIAGSIGGAVAGFGGFYAFAWLYERFSGKMGLGGGDIKLLGMIGAFTGPWGVLVTVLGSSIIGSVVGVTWAVLANRGRILGFAVPYGPFLVLGALMYHFFGDLWHRFLILT